MPGYQFLSQPGLSNAGGAGIFVQDPVKVSIRPKLTKSEPGFEALWIEVLDDAHSNQLCGVIYRHPNGNISEFIEYLNFALDKTNREKQALCDYGKF